MRRGGKRDLIGSIIGGRYKIIRTLGQGGMAHVYLAYDLETKSECAVKLMREDIMDDPEFVQRFATEARAAASLEHPNIVRVTDYGQDGELRYIVQEYVEGTTLKELIYQEGCLNWQLAVPLLIQISLGLKHAHKRGIIHRDMKPQNVLVTPNMVAKVTDFGIARAQSVNTITLTGGLAFGSVHYFSPEQARGEPVTIRSDLYSLGIMLYEMLTGELPFDGESNVSVAIQQVQEMPRRPSSIQPDIPPALDDIIFRAIQKRPERRYPSAAAFVNELDTFMVKPDGIYGVIPKNASPNPPAPATSALGIQKHESNYDKVREIEEKIAERRRSRILSGVLVFCLVIAMALGLMLVLQRGYKEISKRIEVKEKEEDFIVGRYQGKSLDEVRQELGEKGVQVEVVYEKNATVKLGYIFKQDPDNGIKLKPDELKVKLYVSQGEEQIKIPDLIGKDYQFAYQNLKSLGFDVLERREKSKTIERDQVIKMDPLPNSMATPGSLVYLYVSEGEGDQLMPQLYEGMPLTEVRKILEDAKIAYQEMPADDKVKTDLPDEQKVLFATSVEAGAKIQPDTPVVLAYAASSDLPRLNGEEDGSNAHSGNVNAQQSFSMPNLVGLNYVSAINRLNNLGVSSSNIRVAITAQAENLSSSEQYVIHVYPGSGTQVAMGTVIELQIGTYREWVSGFED